MSLQDDKRHVQIAFNGDLYEVRSILPKIPYDSRIFIEAGTPFIKREGANGIREIRRYWPGIVVADLKVTDGAIDEVFFASAAGASAATAMGSAPKETLDLFIEACAVKGMYSIIDMLGVKNPLKFLMPLKKRPDMVVIHKGRDEESNERAMIRYKDINKIRSKFDCMIEIAGGISYDAVQEVFFNGGNVAILNIVRQNEENTGIPAWENMRQMIPEILTQVGR